jgi:hypothetical protein
MREAPQTVSLLVATMNDAVSPPGQKRKAAKTLVAAAGLILIVSLLLPGVAHALDASVRVVSLKSCPAEYDQMMAALGSLLRDKFHLPVSQPKLLLYPGREAFESNLVHVARFDPVYAREVAGWAVAVGAPDVVLANEEALGRLSWPERIRVLAHELVHTVQYVLAGGRRSTSDQWLREGFADWIAYRVLESLDPVSLSSCQTPLYARIKGAARRLSSAPLSEMVTFDDFTRFRARYGGSSAYGESLLATEFLVERHGIQAVLVYFGLFRHSDDRLENFRFAFNEDLSAFAKEFAAYVDRI